jgi:hypothetical protein
MRICPLLLVLGVLVLLASCSVGPAPPQPGSPAFYWAGAQESYRAGDLVKTNDDLLEIIQSENDYTVRARVWQIVLSAGLLQGVQELAKAYEVGSRMNRENPLPFRKQIAALRGVGSRQALELTQSVHALVGKGTRPEIVLPFSYPPGSGQEPAGLAKISTGRLLQDSEAQALEIAMLQRGAIMTAGAVIGAGNPGRAEEKFRTGEVRAARETFLSAIARILFEQSEIFGDKQLDQPRRLKAMCDEAIEVLHAIPETKDTKALETRIQAVLKKFKMT